MVFFKEAGDLQVLRAPVSSTVAVFSFVKANKHTEKRSYARLPAIIG